MGACDSERVRIVAYDLMGMRVMIDARLAGTVEDLKAIVAEKLKIGLIRDGSMILMVRYSASTRVELSATTAAPTSALSTANEDSNASNVFNSPDSTAAGSSFETMEPTVTVAPAAAAADDDSGENSNMSSESEDIAALILKTQASKATFFQYPQLVRRIPIATLANVVPGCRYDPMILGVMNPQQADGTLMNPIFMDQILSQPEPNAQRSTQVAVQADNASVTSEYLYATELSQLQEMGFKDTEENITDLQATSWKHGQVRTLRSIILSDHSFIQNNGF